ncbi:O-antigen ligase family protein [Pseudoflavitalea rhizosphaerae]|uniref:O-antigen ligase family protein n=1 Tax=Pseudoflavitalea rhizosphaerae TaxID=1884793 RepID=UPI000F8E5A61|nr:O-antigen ligase family protein [Pseudoflavitalea rhizosphaerae]
MSISAAIPYSRPLAYRERFELPTWVAWLFVFTVFSRELGLTTVAGVDYDLISYNFFILYFITQLRYFKVSRQLVTGLFLILSASVLSKLYLHLNLAPMWKQIIPIIVIYVASYDAFAKVNYFSLFQIYFQISYYTAILGLVQFFLKLFTGIKIFTGYSALFLDSIAPEPSHYAIIILPAVIYGLYYFKKHKKESLVLIIALLLTTSSTAYMVLLIMLLILYRRIQYLLFMIPLLYFVFNNFLLSYDKFYFRFLGFKNYMENQTFKTVQAATSVSFLSNFEVAIASVKANPLFGAGLGGHEEMYHRYFSQSSFRLSYLYGVNAASAHSLLIRILSETGLLGFGAYLWGLWKTLLLTADDYHRVVSIACLSHFIGKAMKLGGYFDYGTPFFLMVLIFNYIDYKQSGKKKQ